MGSELNRMAVRYAIQKGKPQETAAQFAVGFFKRHPNLHKFAPKKIVDSANQKGSHQEASQQGDSIQLYPKFWLLDAEGRDFVLAHEIGHWMLDVYGIAKLIEDLNKLGVDPWELSQLPFGWHNMDEAFADSFATYFFNRSELRQRYPEWDAVVHAIVS